MQAAKLKLPPGKYENYVATCNRYNGSTKPVHHKAYDDPYSVDWVEDWSKETLFPDEVRVGGSGMLDGGARGNFC